MKIENKEDIASFIEMHLKELGGEAYGVNHIAEKLFEWHESELKNLRLGVAGQSEQLPCSCNNPNGFKEMEEGRETCSKCKKPY